MYEDCNGEAGKVMLMEHQIYHEAQPLKSGLKYAIRTDVLYSKERKEKESDPM